MKKIVAVVDLELKAPSAALVAVMEQLADEPVGAAAVKTVPDGSRVQEVVPGPAIGCE